MKRKILAAIDLSAASVQVCRAACKLARLLEARLILVHIVQAQPPPTPLLSENAFTMAGDGDKAVRADAARHLATLGAWCRKTVPDTKVVQHSGAILSSLLRTIRFAQPDYVVLGSHGHSLLFDAVFGSTARNLIKRAPCPLLLVPIRRPAKPTRRRRKSVATSEAFTAIR